MNFLNDHRTTNNNRGINIKLKERAIARNLLQKNSPPWGKFSGDTKGILILPSSVLLEEKYETTDRFRT